MPVKFDLVLQCLLELPHPRLRSVLQLRGTKHLNQGRILHSNSRDLNNHLTLHHEDLN